MAEREEKRDTTPKPPTAPPTASKPGVPPGADPALVADGQPS